MHEPISHDVKVAKDKIKQKVQNIVGGAHSLQRFWLARGLMQKEQDNGQLQRFELNIHEPLP